MCQIGQIAGQKCIRFEAYKSDHHFECEEFLTVFKLHLFVLNLKHRAVAQLVARFVRDEEVVGSNPASSTINYAQKAALT